MWLSFSSLRFTVSLSIRSGSDAKHDTQLFMKVYGISDYMFFFSIHLYLATASHRCRITQCALNLLFTCSFSCVHFDCLSVCVFVCVCYFCLCFRSTGNTFVLSSNGTLYFVGWYWNQGLRIKCNTFAKCIMSCVFGYFFSSKVCGKDILQQIVLHSLHTFRKEKINFSFPFQSHSYCAKCPFNLSHIW